MPPTSRSRGHLVYYIIVYYTGHSNEQICNVSEFLELFLLIVLS
jgi:hypothetical protein